MLIPILNIDSNYCTENTDCQNPIPHNTTFQLLCEMDGHGLSNTARRESLSKKTK